MAERTVTIKPHGRDDLLRVDRAPRQGAAHCRNRRTGCSPPRSCGECRARELPRTFERIRMELRRIASLKTADDFRDALARLGLDLAFDQTVEAGPNAPLAREYR